ncbi:MAG: hypothetical protein QOH83_1705, partial [Solirubrobacteraceae bacterium]|nr:hypothetical protein [Solirubrobacteraceae bacterium]
MTKLSALLGVLMISVLLALSPAAASAAIPGPVGSWGFDDAGGTTAADATGAGLTGTVNGPTWAAGGKFGGALSFDGVNDTVAVADVNALDLTNGMTLEAWVRPSVLNGWQTVILKERPGDLAFALYGNSSATRPATHIWTTADVGVNATAALALALNTWTHLAATYDGATLRLYANGTQVATRAAAPPIQVSSSPLRFGGNTIWGEYFSGLIDEIR